MLSQLLERQAEEFRTRDRWHSELLEYIAGEFRETLTLVVDPIERILAHEFEQTDAISRRQLISSHQNAQRLNRLIDEISQMAALNSGEHSLDVERIDLVSFLSDFAESFERRAQWNRIHLWFDAEVDSLEVTVCAHSIASALRHLLSYVLSATTEGGSIRLAVEQEGLYPTNEATISISSLWGGAVSEELSYVLGGTFPGPGTVRSDRRTLGVLLARHLVSLHGGAIGIRKGDLPSIVIRLPKQIEHTETRVAAPANRPFMSYGELPSGDGLPIFSTPRLEQPARTQKHCVLLVDDNASLRSYLSEGLNREYDVQEASDGREALRLIGTSRPSIIVCDYKMPGLDGVRLLSLLKSHAEFQDIPFVLMTSQVSEALKVQALEAGAIDFLLKPVKLNELLAKIHNVLVVEEREKRAELLASTARRQMLRYQLNPHFLFNALNSVRALVLADGIRARHVITELAEYLRYSLRTAHRMEMPLDDEMASVRSYLEIEKIRFEQDLEVSFAIDPDVGDIQVPSLILQPLVENAIKYGLRTSSMPLRIGVEVRRRRDTVRLCVTNSGSWVTDSEAKSLSTGTGLQNVRQRLDAFFPDRHTFLIYESNGQVSAEIKIRLT